MKRPIDKDNAIKWLFGFGIVSIIFAIALFSSEEVAGGFMLLFGGGFLMFPAIKDHLEKNKEEDEDVVSQVANNKKGLDKSINYNFTFGILKQIATHPDFTFDKYFNNDEESRQLALMCLTAVEMAKKIKITNDYLLMPIHFASNDKNKAIIFELPNVKLECECNFVAIVKNKDNSLGYYTNEYYEDSDSYGLCLLNNGIRMILKDRPNNYDEFRDLVLKFNAIKLQNEDDNETDNDDANQQINNK